MRIIKYSLPVFVLAATATLFSCGAKNSVSKPKPPASMSNPVKEGSLNTLELVPEAIQRLGIQTIKAGESNTRNGRVYSGEVMAIPGKTITITAPVAGTLLAAGNSQGLQAGQTVHKGQEIYRLVILPSEKDLLSAREDVAQKEVQFEVSTQKLERTKKLLEEKAGSLRAVQEAEAELAGIRATLNVAKARLELLKGNSSSGVANNLSTLNMQAPVGGRVQRVFSTPSQVISAAAPIAEITTTDALWVRVPLYAGDINRVNKQGTATVQFLSDFQGSKQTISAKPVQGPQTADPLNTSVDLYYEIVNSDGRYSPGEKVSVDIPFVGQSSAIMIPYSAIVYDIHGNAWVYGQTGTNTFARIRVEIARVDKDQAVIKRGLKGGETMVITGAAELFGTEFGGGK